MARQTLRQFILECLTVSDSQDVFGAKRCSALSLVHMQGSQEIELRTIKIGAKAHDPKELAQLFEGTADNYAGGIPGTQQFVLLAFFDDDSSPRTRYPFRKSADPDHSGLGTEGPTTSGVTSQLMRHNEALSRINASHQSETFRELMTMLREEREENKQLRREQADTIELAKQLILQSAADSHKRELEIMRVLQGSKDRETLMRLLPPIVNKVTGKEIFPQAAADTALFEQLVEGLEPDQVMQLSKVLKPEQWALLADRLTQILRAKQKREEAEAELRRKVGKKVSISQEGTSENGKRDGEKEAQS